MVKERHPKALYINLLLAQIKRELLARPESLLEMVRAQPIMAAELGEVFEIESALNFGLLPLRFPSTKPLETLSTYVSFAESWLSIVQDLLIIFQITVFTRRAKRWLTILRKIEIDSQLSWGICLPP